MERRYLSLVKDARWKKALRLAIEANPDKALDVGCKDGSIGRYLIEAGVEVYGVDIDPKNNELAQANGLKVVQADVSKRLPFKDKSFNLVFAGEIIEHIVDTDGLLAEFRRVLTDDGLLVITTPNLVNLENRLRVFIGFYPIFVDYTSRGDNHVRAYTGRALKRQLQETGFIVETCTGSFVPPVLYSYLKRLNIALMPVLSGLGSLFPNLSIHVILSARKNTR